MKEKISQLWSIQGPHFQDKTGSFDVELMKEGLPNSVCQVTRPFSFTSSKSALEMVREINKMQHYFVTQTRLGIPVIFHEEALHGLRVNNCTSYPQAIALGGTWDPDLMESIFTLTAREARRRGITQVLSPVVDLALEPRWGRFEEAFSEDPFLCAKMGLASVKGLQGTDPDRIPEDHIIATLKHFVHAMPVGGFNKAPSYFSERFLRQNFFYPFRQIIQLGHVRSIMPSYNEIDGIPCHASKWLLTDILRKEWDFRGVVVSDYGGIIQFVDPAHIAANKTEAAAIALNSGVDVELPSVNSYGFLGDAIDSLYTSEEQLDISVRRVLRIKFELGLFDQPYVDEQLIQQTTMDSKEGRDLALQAAHESIVLLKNQDGLVPLDPGRLSKIAVIGPNADKMLLGSYSSTPSYYISVLDGIRNKVKNSVNVVYSEGCKISENEYYKENIILQDTNEAREGIKEAYQVARDADVILLAIGANQLTAKEGGDRTDLRFVGLQDELIDAMVSTGKPVIALLINGQPLNITDLSEKVPVIFECWYLGQEAGNAVADILFGDVSPSGKLSVSIPRNVGQVPVYYYKKNFTEKKKYIFTKRTPLYHFGYGLSYTSFKYSNIRLQENKIHNNESTSLLIDVSNTGDRKGTEIVQLYVRDLISSVTRPVKELKGFLRVSLEPGTTMTVELPLKPEHLAFYNREMELVVEPGDFKIMAGGSSRDEDLMETLLTVIK